MTTTLLVLNGAGNPVNMLAEIDGSGYLALHSVPQIAGAVVSSANPLPTQSIAPAITPVAGDVFQVTTGGQAVTVFGANEIVHGAQIINPANAATSLFVDMVNTPTAAAPGANGTTEEIYAGSKWTAPGPLTTAVRVNSSDNAHVFTAVRY